MIVGLIGAGLGAISAFSEASTLEGSGDSAMYNASLQSQLLLNSGYQALIRGNFQKLYEQINNNRELDIQAREANRAFGKKEGLASASGTDSNSKSFLLVANAALTIAEQTAIKTRNESVAKQRQYLWEAGAENVAYKNKARATLYAGQVQQWQAYEQADQMRMKAIFGIVTAGIGALIG